MQIGTTRFWGGGGGSGINPTPSLRTNERLKGYTTTRFTFDFETTCNSLRQGRRAGAHEINWREALLTHIFIICVVHFGWKGAGWVSRLCALGARLFTREFAAAEDILAEASAVREEGSRRFGLDEEFHLKRKVLSPFECPGCRLRFAVNLQPPLSVHQSAFNTQTVIRQQILLQLECRQQANPWRDIIYVCASVSSSQIKLLYSVRMLRV